MTIPARYVKMRLREGFKMRIEVTKCYLVQILDDEGNEITSEYTFKDNKREAMEVGKDLLEMIDGEGLEVLK